MKYKLKILISILLIIIFGISLIFIFKKNANTNQNKDKILKEVGRSSFNMDSKKVLLNNGREMPIIGLGTWQLTGDVVENSVYVAIKNGYRLIDTAYWYGNEAEVGASVRRAINDGLVTREELFITTKLPPYGFSDYEKAIDDCNERLGLDYIDLMLVHQSGSDEKKLYKAIENKIEEGVVKTLGISNYYTKEAFDDIIKDAKIMPAVIQNENHIFYNDKEFQEYVSKYGIVIESYYPFGGRGHTSESLNNEVINNIAKKYNKTSAEIILRWHIQSEFIAIPGSSNEEHIKENISIFDFELTDEEMNNINKLNTGKRYENW